jgi:catalase (peroxidase I)
LPPNVSAPPKIRPFIPAVRNAEPATTGEDILNRNSLHGLTTKEYVALPLMNYPSVAALKRLYEIEDMTAQALKYRPEFMHWVDSYISSNDKVFANDFACNWSKLMNINRFDGPINNLSTRNA